MAETGPDIPRGEVSRKTPHIARFTLPRRAALRFALFTALALPCLVLGCGRSEPGKVQGYVEGEYVYMASPLAGTLENLYVRRGMRVTEGTPLFVLDSTYETAARNEAERRVAQAKSNLDDARKGKRPTEITSLEEQLKQVRAAIQLSEKELARREHLFEKQAVPAQEVDRARSTNDQNVHRASQLEADIATAKLGLRTDQISAADAALKAQEAALERARWELDQKSRSAPRDALVFDTLYREGEWVAAGHPVVILLPPQNVKVRAFVPETAIGAVHYGDKVRVTVDGLPEPVTGTVSFISPHAEYTPPVIYSREARSKLVFMIEAVFDPAVAERLHPGQPVDVRFGPAP